MVVGGRSGRNDCVPYLEVFLFPGRELFILLSEYCERTSIEERHSITGALWIDALAL
jgi:hypothetical protein